MEYNVEKLQGLSGTEDAHGEDSRRTRVCHKGAPCSLPGHERHVTPSWPLLHKWSEARRASGSAAPRSLPGQCSRPFLGTQKAPMRDRQDGAKSSLHRTSCTPTVCRALGTAHLCQRSSRALGLRRAGWLSHSLPATRCPHGTLQHDSALTVTQSVTGRLLSTQRSPVKNCWTFRFSSCAFHFL